MSWDAQADDATIYQVVVNDEEQYSIWPVAVPLPGGWTPTEVSGKQSECLAHIDRVWTDMRPASLRRAMEAAAGRPQPTAGPAATVSGDLVARLSSGRHPVELRIGADRTAKALQARVGRGYLHLRFRDTRGGTEIGLQLDPAATDLTGADFVAGSGTIRLAGRVTLDGVHARCRADVDVATLTGEGALEPVAT